LTFSELHYFVWDNTSRSTTQQTMLEIWREWPPWLRLCPRATYCALARDLAPADTTLVTPGL